MNRYKSIVLALLFLPLVTPHQTMCESHPHIFGNYIHLDGTCASLALMLPGFLWIAATVDDQEVEAGWHSPHKEGLFRSVCSASLSAATMAGIIRVLFCFDATQNCDVNTTYSDAWTWMKVSTAFGALCGLGRWILYKTPEHALKRAQELFSHMPTYQRDLITVGQFLYGAEDNFWKSIEATYYAKKYPLVSATYCYEIIQKRLSRILQYLEQAEQNGASGEQLTTIQEIRDAVVYGMDATIQALIALKQHPSYYTQVQAHTQEKIATTQEQILAEQRWNNWKHMCNNWR